MAFRLTLLAMIAAALALPAGAAAGGWATVGFDPPPHDLRPGEPWRVELTILQHGRTPLEGVKPAVIVSPAEGGARSTFRARPTGKPGVYRANVVFESAGRWRYVVDDGFAAEHDYPAVEIGKGGTRPVTAFATAAATPPSAGDDGPNVLLALGVAAVAAVAAGMGAAFVQRRRGPDAAGP